MSNAHARDQREPYADVIAVWNYYIVEALELRAQHFEIGVKGIH